MSANIKKAIEKYGQFENMTRWMLEDGSFLGVRDWEDHRIVGQFCTVSWLDFLKKGCVSIHYDRRAGYLSIRVNGDLNYPQRAVFQELFEREEIRVTDLYVQVYDGDKFEESLNFDDNDEEMIKLYLTDRVAYNLEKQYQNQPD
jgi:hypothetical protein